MGNKNTNLHKAKKAKNDEFYTTRESVEMELSHYKEHFRGKVVYCNCDDPIESEFTWYFARKFEDWGLKKLISTGYKENGHGVMYVYEGDKNGNRMPDRNEWVVNELNGNGDFRSEECVELLKQADIVVSNPPFSCFREYLAQLVKYDKKFLVIGNSNAITYKEAFPLIKENKLWLGVNPVKEFITPLKEVENEKTQYMKDGKVYQKFGNICWFTNLMHSKRNRPLDLVQKYDERYYNIYDNYPAVNIDKVVDIPKDEDIILTIPEEAYPKWKSVYGEDLSIVEDNGEPVRVKVHNPIYGVPITFLGKYCPAQFRIVEFRKGVDGNDLAYTEREREREREFHTSEYLSGDCDSRIDEQSEGHQSQGKKLLRKDIGS